MDQAYNNIVNKEFLGSFIVSWLLISPIVFLNWRIYLKSLSSKDQLTNILIFIGIIVIDFSLSLKASLPSTNSLTYSALYIIKAGLKLGLIFYTGFRVYIHRKNK